MENKNNQRIIVAGAGIPEAGAIMRILAEEHQIPVVVLPMSDNTLEAIKSIDDKPFEINPAFQPEPFIINALPRFEEPVIPRDKWGNILENKSQYHK